MKTIGFWKTSKDSQESLPWPGDLIDPTWSQEDRNFVAGKLAQGSQVNSWRGPSMCRICGKMNGSTDLSAHGYLYPHGLSHYIRVHGVRFPELKDFCDK
jgi:hypothetical protein